MIAVHFLVGNTLQHTHAHLYQTTYDPHVTNREGSGHWSHKRS